MAVAMFPMMIFLLLGVAGLVVLAVLFAKRRAAAATAIIVVASLVLLTVAMFTVWGVSHRRAVPVSELYLEPATSPSEDAAAIWQPGVEDQFEASVYPSKLAAVRSLGLRIGEPIRQLFGDESWPKRGILFQGTHGSDVLDELIRTIGAEFPQTQWTIALETAAVEPNEVGIRLDVTSQVGRPPWKDAWNSGNVRDQLIGGTARASVMTGNRQVGINAVFEEKPWIENFYGPWNDRPNTHLIIAKSAESCLTEAEANSQAMGDACNQLTQLLRRTPRAQATPSLPRNVTANDVLDHDFIVDRFIQSFDGRAGKIWRQALLIDASGGRLEQLARHKAAVSRNVRLNWARMFGSIIGLLTLITVVYAFLNAATKGYYTWSLRIAGVILAAAVIILFVA